MILLPLVGGIPGGLELVVILIIFLIMLGIPAALVLLGLVGYGRLSSKNERIEDLERRIDELEGEVSTGSDESTGNEEDAGRDT